MTYRSKHAGFWIVGVLAAGLVLATACTKPEDTASATAAGAAGGKTPPTAASQNVPASAAADAQGAQKMGEAYGQQQAANAAAYKAAKEKAEGK